MTAGLNSAFGGIHVSNEIQIDVRDTRNGESSLDIEMTGLGVHSEAGVAVVEPETFADQLMALTTAERRLARSEVDFRQD